MKSAIVTGATGFVGCYLVAELLSAGVEVTALCRENSPNISRLPPGVRAVYGYDRLPRAEVFYHLAWDSPSGPGRSDAVLQAGNITMALKALEAAHRQNCKRFIGIGTVYEKLAPQVLARGGFSNADFYVLGKAYAHSLADKLAYKHKLDFCWCTICQPIGLGIKSDQLTHYVVSKLLNGERPVLGPSDSYFDIAAVEDAAYGMRLLGEAEELSEREYYIGSGEAKPLKDWLELVRLSLKAGAGLGLGERPGDGLCFNKEWFDITPVKRDAGYAPRASFDAAVKAVAATVKGRGLPIYLRDS